MWLYICFVLAPLLYLFFMVAPCLNFVLKLTNYLLKLPDIQERAVLITGCDTGFGRLLAIKLLQNGMHVFASFFTEKGESSFREESELLSGKLVSFSLDVTSDESVRKAAELVKEQLNGEGLCGLVNNAGILGPTFEDSFLNVRHYQHVMDVNLLGVVRVTHAFKPLLKKSRGRIINMASCAGRVAGPGMAPYFASKHALEAYSDSLRHELLPFGVTVHVLEPEVFKTEIAAPEIIRKTMDNLWVEAPEETRAEFGQKFFERSKKLAVSFFDKMARTDVDWVTEAYFHALTNKFPLKRYLIGYKALFFWMPLSLCVTTVQDKVLSSVLGSFNLPVAQKCKKADEVQVK